VLVARTLPLLLILVVFLLFAAELWQAAHALGLGDVVAVTVVLAIAGSVFVVTVAHQQIRGIEAHGDDRTPGALLSGTPAAGVTGAEPQASSPQRPLRRPELLNLLVLVLINQLLQALFVAVMVAVFLVMLGVIVVPASVQDAWAGAAVRELVSFVALDEPRTLSVELVIAAGLLGGMCGLYFMGFALTDAAYRAEFDARVMTDIRRIMAVRSVYLAMPHDRDPSGRPPAASWRWRTRRR